MHRYSRINYMDHCTDTPESITWTIAQILPNQLHGPLHRYSRINYMDHCTDTNACFVLFYTDGECKVQCCDTDLCNIHCNNIDHVSTTGPGLPIPMGACLSNPCAAGICTPTSESYYCTCEAGYYGMNCDKTVP